MACLSLPRIESFKYFSIIKLAIGAATRAPWSEFSQITAMAILRIVPWRKTAEEGMIRLFF
jgi:hypothetical protein